MSTESKINFEQNRILEKIQHYLRLKIEIHRSKLKKLAEKKKITMEEAEKLLEKEFIYRLEDIDVKSEEEQTSIEKVFNQGHCSGLTSMWLIAISEGKEKDFFADLEALLSWDGHEKSLIEDEAFQKRMDSFINDLRILHDKMKLLSLNQRNLDKIYNILSPKNKKIREEFNLAFLFNKKELTSALKEILVPGKMVRVSSSNHAMGIFVRETIVDGMKKTSYHYYDSNQPKGGRVFSSIGEVSSELIDSLFGYVEVEKNMPISFVVYDWEDNKISYDKDKITKIYENFYKKDPKVFERISYDNQNMLTHACKHGDRELLKFCLKHGMKTNVLGGGNKKSPVEYALDTGGIDILRDLLDAGADITSSYYEKTYLIYAIMNYNSSSEIIQLLCEYGSPINKADERGKTALHYAIEQDNLAAMEILCKFGADIQKKDNKGTSPLSYAQTQVKTKPYLLKLLNQNAQYKTVPPVKFMFGEAKDNKDSKDVKEVKSDNYPKKNT